MTDTVIIYIFYRTDFHLQDDTKLNKKIVFDDDGVDVENLNTTQKSSKPKNPLFESDDEEEEEFKWNEEELEAKADTKRKVNFFSNVCLKISNILSFFLATQNADKYWH